MQSPESQPGKNIRPSPADIKKWEGLLANEGMPSELPSAQPEEKHSVAYDEAIRELQVYYLTTDREDWGAHREKLQGLVATAKAAGASEQEVSSLTEDLARDIEDQTTDISRHAVEFAQDIVRKSPMLASRPQAVEAQVTAKLRKDYPEMHRAVIRAAAELAAKTVS